MIRKTLVLTAVLFAVIVASAQAHTIAINATCGSVTLQWFNFNDGGFNNSLNGGQNTPTWQVAFTPAGQSSPTTNLSGQVTFGNQITERNVAQYTLTVGIPAENGTVQVLSSWTSHQTSDGNADSVSQQATITTCSYTPSLTTSATPAVATAGTPITDVATLSGGFQPTGSITWRLYGPNDPNCTNPNAPLVTTTNVHGDGAYTSPPLTPTQAGSYHWVASYSGDVNNTPVGPVGCNDPNEAVTIRTTPGLTTSASPAVATVGTAIADVATLSGGSDPTGTISWRLYGPNDPGCTAANPPIVSVLVNGDGPYTSPTITPTQGGTYHWVASYGGDAFNLPVGPVGCNDPSEQVTIQTTPGLTTSASPAVASVGTAIRDVATLSGGNDPTGTITWKLYGPSDNSCTAANPPTVTLAVNGDGPYTSPTITPTQGGTYHWVASYGGDAFNLPVGPVGCNDPSEQVTIQTTPGLTTSASPAVASVGTAIRDVATLSGGNDPTGTITWKLYGPSDNSCTAANPPTVTLAVNGDGPYTSPTITPTQGGTYHWVASYGGDAFNLPIGPVGCNDPSEQVTIQTTPGLTTSASPAVATVGTAIRDVATLSGGNDPTGTITWKLYGPSDNSCSAANPPTVTLAVNGDGPYTSPTITPTQGGTYHWVASYGGDAFNLPVGPVGCNDPSEQVTIQTTPGLTTSASPAVATVGTAIKDVATLSGGNDPTGTITWKLYGPSDNSCTAANPPTVTLAVNGDGPYTSPTITPTQAGTYHWVASYGGDAFNLPVGPVGCNDPSEQVTIQATPALTTSASPASATVGTSIKDVATLTGGDSPTGRIVWKLYGPNDPGCSAANAPSVSVSVSGNGAYSSPTLPASQAGTYEWVASYTGDAFNASIGPVGCDDPAEQVTITPAGPALTTTATPATASVNTAITDVATLSGAVNPTGTIVWDLYGPNDPSCSASSPPSVSDTVTGNGPYTSPPLTPTSAGSYHWVATYESGDANNTSVGPVGCADPSEAVTIQATPALTTSASPASANLGAAIKDVATLSGGDNPTGTITWKLYGPNDSSCSATNPPSVSDTVNGDGAYTSPTITPSQAGTYHWVASYGGDTFNLPVGPVGCTDPNEAVTLNLVPSFTLQKLQSLTTSGYTSSPITAPIGSTINYEIVVTNTGNTPLSLALVDTMCTAIGGPNGDISDGYLAIGGTATYTCVHVVVADDAPTYVNVAQVTATPPGGSPLPPQRSSVLANVPRQAVQACTTSTTKLTQTAKTVTTVHKSNGKTVTTKNQIITAILSDPNHGTDISKVVFSLDGRKIKTLTKPNLSDGRFEVTVSTASTRYGAHRITAAVTMTCGPGQTKNVSFQHALPAIKIIPRFTG